MTWNMQRRARAESRRSILITTGATLVAVVSAAGAGDPCGTGGSCFEAHAAPGCSQILCCESVCGLDPFCCELSWDTACAETAGIVCPPPSPVPGFSYDALGGAVLASVDGDLTVSGDSELGPFGVTITYGSITSGVGSGVIRAAGASGPSPSLACEFVTATGLDRLTLTSDSVHPENAALATVFGNSFSPQFEVRVYNAGTLVGLIPGQSSGTVTIGDPGNPGLFVWQWVKVLLGAGVDFECNTKKIKKYYPNGVLKSEEETTTYSISLGAAAAVTGGGTTFIGDRIELALSTLPKSTVSPPVAANVVATDLDGFAIDTNGSGPQIRFGSTETQPAGVGPDLVAVSTVGLAAELLSTDGTVQLWGDDANGDGAAELHLLNTGPSGDDGVRLLLGGATSASLDFEVVGEQAPGAFVSLTATGVSGGYAGQLLLESAPGAPGALDLTADLSGIGSGNYQLLALNRGVLVYAEGGVNGISGSCIGWPNRFGKLGGPTPCFFLDFDAGTFFAPASGGGQDVPCDEIRMIAEGPASLELLGDLQLNAGLNKEGMIIWLASVALPPIELPCLGDLDDDGTVAAGDLGVLLGAWSSSGAADLDGSGTIDSADLAILLGAWGPCP